MSCYIDLNCDLGEGHTLASANLDQKLMQFISSCSIACGGHAGSPETMHRSAMNAMKAGLRIGAHPSYPDKQGFGRHSQALPEHELRQSISEQIMHLKHIVDSLGGELSFVKPHGALYNDMAGDADLSLLLLETVKVIDPGLKVMGLAGSLVEPLCDEMNIEFISEAFADRRYLDNGQLTPRSEPDAVISDSKTAADQIISLALHAGVTSVSNRWVSVNAQSVCIHSDTPGALEHLESIHNELIAHGFTIAST
jgi:UPF0271 protein